MFSNHFITNFPQNAPVKKIKNGSIFDKDIVLGQNFVAYFFGPPCIFNVECNALVDMTKLR